VKLVILDRDGVINEDSDAYIRSVDEWVPLRGSLAAIARLNAAGWRVAVATNQSGIARGYYTVDDFHAMQGKMQAMLARLGGTVEGVFFCPHGPDDRCVCRKPRTGLFEEIARRLRVDLRGVPAVGDALRDLQAAERVGAQPVLVRTGKGRSTEADGGLPAGTLVFDDLHAFVDALLEATPAP
jgi:D-glycero-D-manno-heptose 1,7-bisphosphate phosphatase